jgi:hypothetical protein
MLRYKYIACLVLEINGQQIITAPSQIANYFARKCLTRKHNIDDLADMQNTDTLFDRPRLINNNHKFVTDFSYRRL